jgi:SAM-dependent methyltransferase/FKBP-type peptidyl-prolyl cis-trans isomerase 2
MSDIIDSKSLATLYVSLSWQSAFASHVETFYVPLNVWRELDLFPHSLAQALAGQRAGSVFKTSFSPGSLVAAHDKSRVRWFPQETFAQGRVVPRSGRFYPRGLLPGYAQNPQPFRCTATSGGEFSADFNHPLAKQNLELEIAVAEVQKKRADTGGVCHDWLQIICDGPGMQVRQSQTPTDFFTDDPFARGDNQDDARFYGKPRLVNHIDAQADAIISSLYGRLLKPGSKVLDLMSSWNSHLPESLEVAQLTGLGLNHEELAKNPRLTDYVVHDLNHDTILPFGNHEFEAVICTVSMEYLTHPGEIFREVVRILKPGGIFIHTFSNRWFPPKVVRIWTELLEWERSGLVLEYFLLSGAFDRLHTFSARGWPRPVSDRYFPQVPVSDPVYAIWGQTRA